MRPSTIIVCDTCRWEPDVRRRESDSKTGGEVLAELVERKAEAEPRVAVERHSCLAGCKRHCNVTVVSDGKYSYYLTQFAPDAESAAAIVQYAALHSESENGIVPIRQWPDGVRGHFMGRIPPRTAPE